jgi:hypothetical protein
MMAITCHTNPMPKGPQGQKRRLSPVHAFLVLVVSVLAFTDTHFGPRIQAWYATMPPATAKVIGGSLFLVIAILVALTAIHIAYRSSDAKRS